MGGCRSPRLPPVTPSQDLHAQGLWGAEFPPDTQAAGSPHSGRGLSSRLLPPSLVRTPS